MSNEERQPAAPPAAAARGKRRRRRSNPLAEARPEEVVQFVLPCAIWGFLVAGGAALVCWAVTLAIVIMMTEGHGTASGIAVLVALVVLWLAVSVPVGIATLSVRRFLLTAALVLAGTLAGVLTLCLADLWAWLLEPGPSRSVGPREVLERLLTVRNFAILGVGAGAGLGLAVGFARRTLAGLVGGFLSGQLAGMLSFAAFFVLLDLPGEFRRLLSSISFATWSGHSIWPWPWISSLDISLFLLLQTGNFVLGAALATGLFYFLFMLGLGAAEFISVAFASGGPGGAGGEGPGGRSASSGGDGGRSASSSDPGGRGAFSSDPGGRN